MAFKALFHTALLILTLALSARAAAPGAASTLAKSFAVFSVGYKPGGGPVLGGVGGTAFFVSPTEVVTAYHVLQPATFKAKPAEKRRTWLVREHFRPIEIKPEYLTYEPEHDLTIIHLPATEAVPPALVYPTLAAHVPAGQPRPDVVETHGFKANSAGPTLVWANGEVEIADVPRLERLNMKGRLLADVSMVSIQARDLNMQNSPCVQLSYQPVVGISGGPVTADGFVFGMNSFADPKTRDHTWAVRIGHI